MAIRIALIAHDRRKDDIVAQARACNIHKVPCGTHLSTARLVLTMPRRSGRP